MRSIVSRSVILWNKCHILYLEEGYKFHKMEALRIKSVQAILKVPVSK